MTMTNENVVENIDEIVMRLREIRRDAEDNGGSAHPLGRFGIEATTRGIVDMLALRENFQIQIEAEAEAPVTFSPEAEAEPKPLCNSKNPKNGYGNMGCVCKREAGHIGYCVCEYLHEWQMPHETEADPAAETENPPVKVGDRLRVTANKHGNRYTIGQTVILERITDCDVKTHSLDNSEMWFLGYDEFEIIPETQSAPKPEGMTVAELIGKLQNAPNQNAIIWISSIDAPSATPLKQAGHFRDDPAILFLRDYLATGGTIL